MPMDMEASSSFNEGAAEIVFFDLETTVPKRVGQRFQVLEFGAIVVCPLKLVELESFTTLIRPTDLSAVALRSSRPDGITRETVATAPLFEEVADKIFSILNGRIWAGHNIQRFDCVRIKEAFTEIGRPAPTPVGMVDSLGVLTNKFGKRAGNMKVRDNKLQNLENHNITYNIWQNSSHILNCFIFRWHHWPHTFSWDSKSTGMNTIEKLPSSVCVFYIALLHKSAFVQEP